MRASFLLGSKVRAEIATSAMRGRSGRARGEGGVSVMVVVVVAATMLLLANAAARAAVIAASFDESKPSGLASTYPVDGVGAGGGGGGGGAPNVSIVEDVALSNLAGPWLKDLVNSTASGFLSGENRLISETLTNVGTLSWTGWHERVISRANTGGGGGGGGDGPPGFLFRENSLVLSANYGAGMVPLTQGVDYTIATTSGPPGSGNGPDWETITITFAPNRVIETGDVLNIRKDIFEVFGDGNIWQSGEAARIGEFPIGVPEPGTFVLVGAVAAGAMVRRRTRGLR